MNTYTSEFRDLNPACEDVETDWTNSATIAARVADVCADLAAEGRTEDAETIADFVLDSEIEIPGHARDLVIALAAYEGTRRGVLGVLCAVLMYACSGAHVPEPLDAGSEPVDAAALEVDAAPALECTPREDVCALLVRSYDRTACGFVTPNCPPFGLDLSRCGPLLDAARTCADVQAALLLCRRCP